jgi:hypothetical protein
MKPPPHAVIGIYGPGQTRPALMSSNGRVVVFDHAAQARQYLPLLGAGRPTRWSSRDEVYWLPLDPEGINRACVITEYDPYNLPPGLPVRSETRGREWRHHIHMLYVFHDAGQMRQRADGSWANLALGEE